jgi:shikimate dehydrogenase
MIALQENGIFIKEKKLVLLGAGGSAKAIAYQSAKYVEELVILNRTLEKAKKLAESIRKNFKKKVKGESLSFEVLKKELETADILINSTSVGMHPAIDNSPVPSNLLHSDLCVMDIIYNPLDTLLLKSAKNMGAKVVSGVEMLIYQGAVAFEIWTNYPAPVKIMRKAALSQLKKQGVILDWKS